MKNGRKILFAALILPMLFSSCELLEEEPEEDEKIDNTTYSYKFKCSVGAEKTIQIPNRLSAACKSNWEFYARTYGCNDADNFALAETRKRQCP